MENPAQILIHGKPEDAYQVGLRFMNQTSKPYFYDYMLELLLQTKDDGSYIAILDEKAGDVPFVTALLPYVTDKIDSLDEFEYITNIVLYPLSLCSRLVKIL